MLDLAANFELLHFQYDRHALSHFTGVGRSSNIELHRALKNFPDSPHDLLLNARALEDLNKQVGAAKIMLTMAPGAYATTWHELCLNVKDVTVCARSETMRSRPCILSTFWIRFAEASCSILPTLDIARALPGPFLKRAIGNLACKHGLTVSSSRKGRARNSQVLQLSINMGPACHTS